MPSIRKKAAPPGPPVGAPHARIHIAAVGFEVERVTAPLEADRADRVYLLTRAERDAAAPFVDEVVGRLRRSGWPVEVRVIRTDLWDVFHALSSLRSIFEAERRVERNAREVLPIRVNVSTGTKITAIAGLDAEFSKNLKACSIMSAPTFIFESGLSAGAVAASGIAFAISKSRLMASISTRW